MPMRATRTAPEMATPMPPRTAAGWTTSMPRTPREGIRSGSASIQPRSRSRRSPTLRSRRKAMSPEKTRSEKAKTVVARALRPPPGAPRRFDLGGDGLGVEEGRGVPGGGGVLGAELDDGALAAVDHG